MAEPEKKKRFFKVPQTKVVIKQNVILGIGIIMMIAGIFLLSGSLSGRTCFFAFRTVLLLSFGGIAFFMALALAQNSFLFFVGLTCFLSGILTLIIDMKVVHLGMKELWPVLVIILGLALIPAGLYHLRRIRTIYLFPAIFLICMGVVFLLFSLKIIKAGFLTVAAKIWPVTIIVGGLALIIVFFVQQNHKNLFMMKDDSLVESDDE